MDRGWELMSQDVPKSKIVDHRLLITFFFYLGAVLLDAVCVEIYAIRIIHRVQCDHREVSFLSHETAAGDVSFR